MSIFPAKRPLRVKTEILPELETAIAEEKSFFPQQR